MAAFGVLAAVLVALSLAVPGCAMPASSTNAATVQALQDAAKATREAAQAIQAATPPAAPADPNGPPVAPPTPAQAAITKAGEALANAGGALTDAAHKAAQAAANQPDNPGAAIGAAVTAAAPLAGPYAPLVAVLGSLTTLAVGWFSRGRVWTAQDRRDAQSDLGLVDARAVASPGIAGPLPFLPAAPAPAPVPVSASRVGPQTHAGGSTP
jgi:membrane-associated protease RseP (regulator of RpoE activity)